MICIPKLALEIRDILLLALLLLPRLDNKGATICPWDSIPMSQTLCICLIWMYKVVWVAYWPYTWCYGIISTPQVNLNPQIWGQLGQCNGIRVQPYALETAYQCHPHFVYVWYGCMKWSEVDVSLNHEVVASFPLLKWTWITKSGGNLASVMV